MNWKRLFAITAGLLLPLAAPVAQAADAVIKVGTNRALGTVTPYVGRAHGEFAARGVTLDIVDFQDGSVLMEAFAAGQLDVAFLGIAPSAIWQSKGVPLKVVAAANGGGHVLLTRTNTGINDLKGLAGKKIATPKPGSVVDTLLRAHVLGELAGLNAEKDVQIVPGVAPADMPAALFVSREVDAAITWEPFATQAATRFKGVKVLFDAAAEWRKLHPTGPLYPVNVVIARGSFIKDHPGALRDFLAGYADTVRFINDKPNVANAIIASELKLDASVVATARQRIDYTVTLDPQAALQTLQWSAKLGYLKQLPTAEKLFDFTYLPKE
ncbi:MAG TPA: ABC transporter substrate-binding protein [Tepidisphaeraceae bacterium]|jgi:NitT/TauT family transport system substrate-binding protein